MRDERPFRSTDAGTARTDIAIVGAGPSGLFAALGIVASSDRRVVILDKGKELAERSRGGTAETASDLVSGVGGAGLFSDGKLCMSLDVGGALSTHLERSECDRLLEILSAIFGEVLEEEPTPSLDVPWSAERRAASAGLQFKYYPVWHIGTDLCRAAIEKIVASLKGTGVIVRAGHHVTSLTVSGEGADRRFKLTAAGPGRATPGSATELSATRVVLAMGKDGADQERSLCERVGVSATDHPMYVGVRVEADADTLDQLFESTKDPKYKLILPDGTKIKTHCATDRGEVLRLTYEGLPLAGGHNFSVERTTRSGFALLWNGIRYSGRAVAEARRIMGEFASATGGRLMVQRWKDFLADQASTPSSLSTIALTTREVTAGNIRSHLPRDLVVAITLFMNRLAAIAPGLTGPRTVLYAPAIEWWMGRVETVNEKQETRVKGLYVCGDGAGWSQGIVHGAATGILASEGITGTALHATSAREIVARTPREAWELEAPRSECESGRRSEGT